MKVLLVHIAAWFLASMVYVFFADFNCGPDVQWWRDALHGGAWRDLGIATSFILWDAAMFGLISFCLVNHIKETYGNKRTDG